VGATDSRSPAGGRGGRTSGTAGAVWLREPRRHRNAPPLTRDRIVAGAVELLDGEGADRLTMRRLAEHLGVGATTVYWHVTTKDDVLDLALDHIFGEVTLPRVSEDWRADARGLIRGWRAAMLHHPWAPGLLGRPMLGPNVLARTEFLQSALARAGFTGIGLAAATHGLANYVIGSALTETTWRRTDDPDARHGARRHIEDSSATYPTLVASGHLGEQAWSDDELFTRGLDIMLAGLDQAPR
jgi:AcrR family transcriptional regulator